MAKDQTIVDTDIWKDPYFKQLLPTAKMVFIHAAFFDPDPYVIAKDLGVHVDTVNEYLDRPEFRENLEKYYG